MESEGVEGDLAMVRRQLECLAFERLRSPLDARRQLLYELLCLREQELLGLEGQADKLVNH